MVSPAVPYSVHCFLVLEANCWSPGRLWVRCLADDDVWLAKLLEAMGPNSRPYPDCLAPPKGMRGSTPPWPLIQVVPASNRAATRIVAARSVPHTDDPSPVSKPLANWMASSTVEYITIGKAGSNCSSTTSGFPGSISATRVVG